MPLSIPSSSVFVDPIPKRMGWEVGGAIRGIGWRRVEILGRGGEGGQLFCLMIGMGSPLPPPLFLSVGLVCYGACLNALF